MINIYAIMKSQVAKKSQIEKVSKGNVAIWIQYQGEILQASLRAIHDQKNILS